MDFTSSAPNRLDGLPIDHAPSNRSHQKAKKALLLSISQCCVHLSVTSLSVDIYIYIFFIIFLINNLN